MTVVPLGDDTYRLEDVSVLVPHYGDEFQAESQPAEGDGREVLVVQRRTAKSGYGRWTTIGRPGDLERPEIARALQELEAAGGHWAVEFGSAFVAAWPPEFDFEGLLRRTFGDDLK